MDFPKKKPKPESIRALLRQQVETQSERCDFNVIHGLFSRRFHSSVLATSLFFQCLLGHNFQEKLNGSVEIHVGTPAALESAIMFLYGKCPKMDITNIGHLLDIADFLLIPNLKCCCVEWLKRQRIGGDNFAEILRLSSLYDFEVPLCKKYIRQHLEDILNEATILSFTKDTLLDLYSDTTLMYVPMETKFKFLLKWTKQCVKTKASAFRELVLLIDVGEVSETVIADAKADSELNGTGICDINRKMNIETGKKHEVLISNAPTSSGFWGFDTVTETWCRLETTGDVERYSRYKYSNINNIALVDKNIICRTNNEGDSTSIHLHSLESNTVRTSYLVCDIKEYGNKFEDISIGNGQCFGVIGNVPPSVGDGAVLESMRDEIRRHIRLLDMDAYEEMHILYNLHDNLPNCNYSVVCEGNLNQEGGITEMTPVLSVKSEPKIRICASEFHAVALVPESKPYIYVYDTNACQLDIINIERKNDDKISATHVGFVLYNDRRIVYISRIQGPSLTEKYITRELTLQDKENENDTRIYCNYYSVGKRLIRHTISYNEDGKACLEYALHANVNACTSVTEILWTPMPLPRANFKSSSVFEHMLTMNLPRSKLRCHIDCPHCELLNEDGNIAQTRVPLKWPLCFRNRYSETESDSESDDDSDDDSDFSSP